MGMQDKAGCSGGAQGDGAEQPSHLLCVRLPLTLPGTASCIEMLCSVAGFSPVLLIRVCGHIFSLTIFNPHFAYSPFSLFSFRLSRQQNIKKKICTAVCGKEQDWWEAQELTAGAALTRRRGVLQALNFPADAQTKSQGQSLNLVWVRTPVAGAARGRVLCRGMHGKG